MSDVAIVMGSDSDFTVMKEAALILKELGISFEVFVISAHRTPEEAFEFAKNAQNNGFKVIIAGAGKAAHLPGVIASLTNLPVIGVPIKSSTFDGLDALLSIVQMPPGVPVATMSIDGAKNAGLYAAKILSINDISIKEKLEIYREKIKKEVFEKNEKIRGEVEKL